MSDGVCQDEAHAVTVAAYILQHFDLAPAGSLTALKASIAKMARSSKDQ